MARDHNAAGQCIAVDPPGKGTADQTTRFGRQLQDGELLYAYDKNGNRTEVGYPGGVMT